MWKRAQNPSKSPPSYKDCIFPVQRGLLRKIKIFSEFIFQSLYEGSSTVGRRKLHAYSGLFMLIHSCRYMVAMTHIHVDAWQLHGRLPQIRRQSTSSSQLQRLLAPSVFIDDVPCALLDGLEQSVPLSMPMDCSRPALGKCAQRVTSVHEFHPSYSYTSQSVFGFLNFFQKTYYSSYADE